MTDGNLISDSASSSSGPPTARAVEAAFRVLHEHLRAVQQQADDLDRARDAAVEEGLRSLGYEARWLDDESDVRIYWDTADPKNFEARLRSEGDLEAALGEFVVGGDLPAGLPSSVRREEASTGKTREWDVEESLRHIQADFTRMTKERAEQIQSLRSELDDSWHHAVKELRAWVREPGRTALEDWGRIQLAWRTALGLPGIRAAEILGISAPAVTRYEKGSRSPSLAYIESMVERIVSHGAEPLNAIFRLADMFKISTAEFLGAQTNDDREHAIREEMTSVLDSLPAEHIQLLTAIAKSREAMAALRTLSAEDHLAPLRRAIVLSGLSRVEA